MSILDKLQPKPRTTVKRFAAELKTRISKVEAAFSREGQEQFVSGLAYVKGIIDALCSDYDVRDPEDFIARPPAPAAAVPLKEPTCGTCGGSGRVTPPLQAWRETCPRCNGTGRRTPEVTR